MTNVIVVLDRTEARALTERIKDTGMALRELIVQAWELIAWKALGYDSWDDYCAQEFAALELELGRDERREIVVSLRESGMSLRAIAAATGVSHEQVRKDAKSGVNLSQEKLTPESVDVDAEEKFAPSPTPIKGRDGKDYPAPKPKPTPPPPAPKPQTMITLYTHEGKPVEYPQPASKPTFNNTSGPGISWAEWSWNPVTGCLHGCDYCYAREIANSNRAAATYPVGFTPLFHSERLEAPANTAIPLQYRDDDHKSCGKGDCKICAYRRVFVCSMADLYGRWVPDEWIEEVHSAMLRSPEWQYILLTKFPSRYVGLDLPAGAFVGTSVDEQKRVRIAEKAFRELPDNVTKWLSLEPLREPLQFDDLSMFDWVVIGAQTATTQPSGFLPAFAPEFDWIVDIYLKAREAGCKVHFKPNIKDGKPGMRMPDEYPSGR